MYPIYHLSNPSMLASRQITIVINRRGFQLELLCKKTSLIRLSFLPALHATCIHAQLTLDDDFFILHCITTEFKISTCSTRYKKARACRERLETRDRLDTLSDSVYLCAKEGRERTPQTSEWNARRFFHFDQKISSFHVTTLILTSHKMQHSDFERRKMQ